MSRKPAKNTIGLVSVLRPEVRGRDCLFGPAHLLEDLADGERLDEMPELGQHSGVAAADLRSAEPEQPAGQPGVDDVHLGVRGDPLAKGRAPRGQPLDHEGRLEQGRVTVRGAAFQADGLPGLGDVEHLAGGRIGSADSWFWATVCVLPFGQVMSWGWPGRASQLTSLSTISPCQLPLLSSQENVNLGEQQ